MSKSYYFLAIFVGLFSFAAANCGTAVPQFGQIEPGDSKACGSNSGGQSAGFCYNINCALGYTSSVSRLYCDGTNWSPAYACIPDCVVPMNPSTGFGAISREVCGTTPVSAGSRCYPRCAPGYYSDVDSLLCIMNSNEASSSNFFPTSYNCVQWCNAPGRPLNAPAVFCRFSINGVDAFPMKQTQQCIPICDSGYEPSIDSLECRRLNEANADPSISYLEPPTFDCVPSCNTPLAPTLGTIVTSPCGYEPTKVGRTCSPICIEGQYSDVSALTCTLDITGTFSQFWPETYRCLSWCAAPPQPLNAPVVFCHADENGADAFPMKQTHSCEAICNAGFYATVARLQCLGDGVREPDTFFCLPECLVPPTADSFAQFPICTIAVNSQEDRFPLMPEEVCYPQCLPGFTPTVETVQCVVNAAGTAAVLVPPSFTCVPQCLSLPVGDANSLSPICTTTPTSSVSGFPLSQQSVCYPQCRIGFSPSVDAIVCEPTLNGAAALVPATFVCLPQCTAAISGVENAPRFACSHCLDGFCTTALSAFPLNAGHTCKPVCNPGWVPSEKLVRCITAPDGLSSSLSPETFVCLPEYAYIGPCQEKCSTRGCPKDAECFCHACITSRVPAEYTWQLMIRPTDPSLAAQVLDDAVCNDVIVATVPFCIPKTVCPAPQCSSSQKGLLGLLGLIGIAPIVLVALCLLLALLMLLRRPSKSAPVPSATFMPYPMTI